MDHEKPVWHLLKCHKLTPLVTLFSLYGLFTAMLALLLAEKLETTVEELFELEDEDG